MRGQRQPVALAVAVAALLGSGSALAFHAGATFGQTAQQGGAGSIFYAGTELERGWDCTMCHTESAGKIDLSIAVDPLPITSGKSQYYVPGQAYAFTVSLTGEHAGLSRAQYNYNAIVVDVVDGKGFFTGKIDGFASTDFVQPYPSVICYGAPAKPNVTSWTFRWTAPDAGAGAISIHMAAVDGDGAAGSTDPDATTDPFHDDVVIRTFRLGESSAATGMATEPLRAAPDAVVAQEPSPAPLDWHAPLAALLGVAFAGVIQARRRP